MVRGTRDIGRLVPRRQARWRRPPVDGLVDGVAASELEAGAPELPRSTTVAPCDTPCPHTAPICHLPSCPAHNVRGGATELIVSLAPEEASSRDPRNNRPRSPSRSARWGPPDLSGSAGSYPSVGASVMPLPLPWAGWAHSQARAASCPRPSNWRQCPRAPLRRSTRLKREGGGGREEAGEQRLS